jgi:hypothetical protein
MNESIKYENLYNNLLIEHNKLKEQFDNINIENKQLIEHLKKYTAPERSKKYYENNKEIINQKNKDYKEKTNYYKNLSPDKKKEYSKRAYEKKKQQLLEEKNKNI